MKLIESVILIGGIIVLSAIVIHMIHETARPTNQIERALP